MKTFLKLHNELIFQILIKSQINDDNLVTFDIYKQYYLVKH